MAVRIDTNFDITGFVDSRIGGRNENQDAVGAAETALGTIVVVCDGMGGSYGGQKASATAISTIIDEAIAAQPDETTDSLLCRSIQKANKNIRDFADSHSEYKGMGTTVAAIIISATDATIAFLGDTRIYQLRGGHKVFRSFDHSVVFQMVQQGILSEEQARLSDQSNVITKCLGVTDSVQPEIHHLPYLKRDRFVLCTDGFWGLLPEKEFIKKISTNAYPKDVLQDTIDELDRIGIKRGGNHDNLSAAILDVSKNSKIKPKMTKTVKIILLVLSILLLSSFIVNLLQCRKIHTLEALMAPMQENVEVKDGQEPTGSSDSLADTQIDSLTLIDTVK